MLDEIEAETFAAKQTELRSKKTRLLTKLEGCGRQHSERADLAVKVFELSQALSAKWLAADIAEKRLLLEIIGLNWTLDGVNLVPQMRKPFDILAEGLSLKKSRGDRRWTFPNDMESLRLFWLAIAQTFSFTGDAIYDRRADD